MSDPGSMQPCMGCGSTDPGSHVYGVRTCCPDCEHEDQPRADAIAARILAVLDEWFPCDCDEAYTGRGLIAPDCPNHNNAEIAVEIAALAPADPTADLRALFAVAEAARAVHRNHWPADRREKCVLCVALAALAAESPERPA